MNFIDMSLDEFIKKLSSSEPVPGGGGVSALIGGLSLALASMVANLTSGKKKYARYQEDIDRILLEADELKNNMLAFIKKDAEAFIPLSKAYGIPKDNPKRDEIMEDALYTASGVPFEILKETQKVLDLLEELAIKGSKLAISDIGVAAAACRCCAESAIMNVFINTKFMQNKERADLLNKDARALLDDCVSRSELIYKKVLNEI